MPVTLETASHPARKWEGNPVSDASKLLEKASPKDFRRSKRIIQSSFSPQLFSESHVSPSDNGFVRAVYLAYSHHHHLTLRPEDVWFSILTQLNFFINAHAEELRSFFVSHDGQKDLEVVEAGTIHSVDFGNLAIRMTEMIEKNILDPELRTWIMPEFSTTTKSDRVVAAILMMGSLQKYFTYTMSLLCGIPTVTLLGEREDWAHMLAKLDKIPQLGKEPTRFAELLRPVLQRFVASFDNPTSPEVLDFWSKCADRSSGGSGPDYFSGWITAFCFWDEDGKALYPKERGGSDSLVSLTKERAGCELDGVYFHLVDTKDIPLGSVSVPVTVNNNGVTVKTKMLAGMVGIQATSSGSMLDADRGHTHRRFDSETFKHVLVPYIPGPPTESPGLDSLQPLSGWWMYETEDAEVTEAREKEKKKIKDELALIDGKRSTDQESRVQAMDMRSKLRDLEAF